MQKEQTDEVAETNAHNLAPILISNIIKKNYKVGKCKSTRG
jgi:hypothetical protein